jgi:pimeloyl-ACP methyl ester carboxylesterase
MMIRLLRYGEVNDAPPLLAIPGIDGSVGSIAPIVEQLAQQRQVLVVDYTAEDNQTMEALTREIIAAVQEEIQGYLDILGQSIGTVIAAQIADADRISVRRAVLIGTFTKLRWRTLLLSNLVTSITPRWLYRLTAAPLMAFVCGPVGDGRQHPFFAAARASDPEGTIKRTNWEIERDFSFDLLQLHVPTLILMGEEDRFVPDVEREISKLCTLFSGRPVRVVTIPHAGHVLLPTAAIATAVSNIEEFLA